MSENCKPPNVFRYPEVRARCLPPCYGLFNPRMGLKQPLLTAELTRPTLTKGLLQTPSGRAQSGAISGWGPQPRRHHA